MAASFRVPMPAMLDAGERLIRGLWAGCLVTIGYLAAPTLFATLDDRAVAGLLAGRMFTAGTFVSLAAAAMLAALYLGGVPRRPARLWLALAVAGLLIGNEWGLRPLMDGARLPDGSPGENFARLHGVSALVWLAASVLAVILAALGPRPVSRPAD